MLADFVFVHSSSTIICHLSVNFWSKQTFLRGPGENRVAKHTEQKSWRVHKKKVSSAFQPSGPLFFSDIFVSGQLSCLTCNATSRYFRNQDCFSINIVSRSPCVCLGTLPGIQLPSPARGGGLLHLHREGEEGAHGLLATRLLGGEDQRGLHYLRLPELSPTGAC